MLKRHEAGGHKEREDESKRDRLIAKSNVFPTRRGVRVQGQVELERAELRSSSQKSYRIN